MVRGTRRPQAYYQAIPSGGPAGPRNRIKESNGAFVNAKAPFVIDLLD
jgi:hypothetical protein